MPEKRKNEQKRSNTVSQYIRSIIWAFSLATLANLSVLFFGFVFMRIYFSIFSTDTGDLGSGILALLLFQLLSLLVGIVVCILVLIKRHGFINKKYTLLSIGLTLLMVCWLFFSQELMFMVGIKYYILGNSQNLKPISNQTTLQKNVFKGDLIWSRRKDGMSVYAKDYAFTINEKEEIVIDSQPTENTFQAYIHGGPLLFIFREFDPKETDETIFSLVPQNTSRPEDRSFIKLKDINVIKTQYTSVLLSSIYNEESVKIAKDDVSWKAYGYIVRLKNKTLFFFVDGYGKDSNNETYNDVWFEKNVLSTFESLQ